MGRTYRNKDKKFKKKLRENRRAKQNKRSSWADEDTARRTEDRRKKNRMESYIFA